MKFSNTTGERLSRPYTQTFDVKEFESFMKRSLEQQGYKVTILHDPKAKNEVEPKAEGKPVSEPEAETSNK